MPQFGSAAKPPVGISFDFSLEGIDSVLAIALLRGLTGKNDARLTSLSVAESDLNAARAVDAEERFYFSPSPFFTPPPIGMPARGPKAAGGPMVDALLTKHKPAITSVNDTAIPEALIRNALTAQYDGNAAIVLSGPATNLSRMLDLPGARELAAAKVRVLAIAAGTYPAGGADPFFTRDAAAMRRVLAEWPTPILFCGRELAAAYRYPAASVEKDFGYVPNHPVRDAYIAAGSMPYDATTHAMAAILNIARAKEDYFRLSGPGTVTVSQDGHAAFKPSADGRHHYLIADESRKADVIAAYAEIVSAKPVVRSPRQRPPQVAPEKKDPTQK